MPASPDLFTEVNARLLARYIAHIYQPELCRVVFNKTHRLSPTMPPLRSRLHRISGWLYNRLQSVRNRLQRHRQEQQSAQEEKEQPQDHDSPVSLYSDESSQSEGWYTIYTYIQPDIRIQTAALALRMWVNEVFDGPMPRGEIILVD